VNRS